MQEGAARKFTDEERAVIRERRKYQSARELGAVYGVSAKSIAMLLRENNRGAPITKRTPDQVERFKALYLQGMSARKIEIETGVCRRTIIRALRDSGIHLRTCGLYISTYYAGDASHNWRGDNASYSSLHKRLYVRFGKPTICSVCFKEDAKRIDYANLTGNYADIHDFAAMCRSCHTLYDSSRLSIEQIRARKGITGEPSLVAREPGIIPTMAPAQSFAPFHSPLHTEMEQHNRG